MALRNCPDCGGLLPDSSEACPNCGWLGTSTRVEAYAVLCCFLVAAAALIWALVAKVL